MVDQLVFVPGNFLSIPLGRPGLANGPAYPTLRISQPVTKMFDSPPPAGWGYKFFELYSMASFMISMSIRWSAMILRRR
jgi:hypothetical protein